MTTPPPPEVELLIRLETKLSHHVILLEDASDYITDLQYEIVGEYFLKNSESNKMESHKCHIGEINLQVIRVGEARSIGWGAFELFNHKQPLHDLTCGIFDFEADEYGPNFLKRFPNALNNWSDIICVGDILLKPWARGQNLALSVLQCVERIWSSGCEFMVLQPFPLQLSTDSSKKYSPQYELAQISDNEQISIKKLEFHFEKIGYRKLNKSPYMLKSLDGRHDISVDLGTSITIPTHIAQQNSLT